MILQGKRILVVEDEPIIAFALEDMLIEDGADVTAVGSLQDGLANARDERQEVGAAELRHAPVRIQCTSSFAAR